VEISEICGEKSYEMSDQRANVLVTFDSHTPYLAFRVSALQKEIEKRGLGDRIRLRVLLLGATDSTYGWHSDQLSAEYGGVPVKVLTEKFHGLGFRNYATALALRTTWLVLWNVLRERPRIAFVGGYDRPASLLIAAVGKVFRWKTGPMHDSRFNDAESYSKKVSLEAVKSLFVRCYNFFMCSGRECIDYTRFLAGPKRPAHFAGWNVLDNHGIGLKAKAQSRDEEIHAALGIAPGEQYFFMPIRFLPKKNVDGVLEAYATAAKSPRIEGHELTPLIITGKGPLRAEMEDKIVRLGLQKQIRILDWVPYDLIPRTCRLSRGVILGSTHDQWGLIVNEALAAGAPVLVSNRCGAHELVRNSLNGYTFDPHDHAHLAELLVDLSLYDNLVERLRAHAAPSMERFSVTQFLEAWFTVFDEYL
jgi:glycosyltransferase involved in cell wall biosynthesis